MSNPWRLKILTTLGILALTPPVVITGLWIYIFVSMHQSDQGEKVNAFFAFFPDFLQNSITLTLVALIFSIVAIIVGAKAFERSNKFSQKVLNMFTLVVGILIGFLQLIYLM